MNLIFLDTETGGLNPFRHSLLQVGMVAYVDGQIKGFVELEVSELNYNTTDEALKVNKLDINDLRKNGVKKELILERIIEFKNKYFGEIEKPVLAGHNISFDRCFIWKLFDDCDLDILNHFSHRSLDTMSILWALYDIGKIPKEACSSEGAFKFFDIKVEKRHTALADAVATVQLYMKLTEMIK